MSYGISDFFLLKKEHMSSCIVFVNFYDQEHASHFIKAMDGSKCLNMILSAEMSNK